MGVDRPPSLSGRLEQAAREWGDRTACIWDGGRWSYRELWGHVEEQAQQARQSGVRPGDRVAVDLASGPDLVCSLYAVWRCGAVAVPLNQRSMPAERESAWRQLGVQWRIGDRGIEGAGSGVQAESLPDDIAALLLTSGTSGSVRAVALRHAGLAFSAEATRERLDLGDDDVWGLVLSPAHVGGLALITRSLLLGSAVRFWGAFDAPAVLDAADAGDLTHISVVPVMLRRLVESLESRATPASLRCVLTGGAGTPGVLLDRALEVGLPVALTYGMTECTSQVATAPPQLVAKVRGTVGPPLAGVEVEVASDGELLVRGPSASPGTVGGAGQGLTPLTDGDGWYATGDLGRMDDLGHLWITGRKDARIVTGGVTVHPAEVEAVIRTMDAVVDVAVVGLPDEEWGERIAAAVVLAGDTATTPSDVDVFCRQQLTRAKCPSHIVRVEALPRTATGKVATAALRALFDIR